MASARRRRRARARSTRTRLRPAGGWQQGDLPPADDAQEWFAGRLPSGWFDDVDVTVDREEITVIGTLAESTPATTPPRPRGGSAGSAPRPASQRIEIAQEAQARYRRNVSWGARVGDTTALFTHLAVPVMTRLRQPERAVLDTLVDAGVARSRSDALAWSVKLVGEHADTWLGRAARARWPRSTSCGRRAPNSERP